MSKEKQTLHIYIRVSTGGQEKDGTSLDSQLKLGKQKAKSLGMDYEVHDERSASSSKRGSPRASTFPRAISSTLIAATST